MRSSSLVRWLILSAAKGSLLTSFGYFSVGKHPWSQLFLNIGWAAPYSSRSSILDSETEAGLQTHEGGIKNAGNRTRLAKFQHSSSPAPVSILLWRSAQHWQFIYWIYRVCAKIRTPTYLLQFPSYIDIASPFIFISAPPPALTSPFFATGYDRT